MAEGPKGIVKATVEAIEEAVEIYKEGIIKQVDSQPHRRPGSTNSTGLNKILTMNSLE